MTIGKKPSGSYSDKETARREDVTLKRLLATPPQPKTKAKPGASPKKRGRPKNAPVEGAGRTGERDRPSRRRIAASFRARFPY